MSRAEVLSLLVLGISAVEVPVLVELIASTNGPDVSLIRICFVAFVAVRNLIDMVEDIALKMTISSAAVEFASRAVQSDALIVCSIVVFHCSCLIDSRRLLALVEASNGQPQP